MVRPALYFPKREMSMADRMKRGKLVHAGEPDRSRRGKFEMLDGSPEKVGSAR